MSSNIAFALPNPAAVYCTQMGYKYNIVKAPQGEYGECIFPDGSKCNEWQFLEGKCGNQYSYCIKNGYDIKTMTDGKNPYSPEYAVCVPKTSLQSQISVTDILSIKSDVIIGTTTTSSTSSAVSSLTSNPSSFDWSNNNGYNWMTPVKDQGSCGSCWDFGALGAVEAKIKIEKNTPSDNPDLSEQDVLSCSSVGSCRSGWPGPVLTYAMNTGIVDENCFLYTGIDAKGNDFYGGGHTPVLCSNKYTQCPNWKYRLTKITDYGFLSTISDSDIKSYLIQNGPLTTYIYMSGYFTDKGIYHCDSINYDRYHAVVLVGYDDADGYWIAKNSWGTGWPYYNLDPGYPASAPDTKGYFRIEYDNCGINPSIYVYATGQKNGVCSKDVGASAECDGKTPGTVWCDGNSRKFCDSVCKYSSSPITGTKLLGTCLVDKSANGYDPNQFDTEKTTCSSKTSESDCMNTWPCFWSNCLYSGTSTDYNQKLTCGLQTKDSCGGIGSYCYWAEYCDIKNCSSSQCDGLIKSSLSKCVSNGLCDNTCQYRNYDYSFDTCTCAPST